MPRKPGNSDPRKWKSLRGDDPASNHMYMKEEAKRVASSKHEYDIQKDLLKDKYESVNSKTQSDYRKRYGKP